MIGPDVRPPPRELALVVNRYVSGIYAEIGDDARAVLDRWPSATLTSWWRGIDRNAEVGGAKASQHLLGLALDWVPRLGDWEALDWFLRSRNWIVVNEGDHIHAQVFRPTEEIRRFVGWASRYGVERS